MPKDTLTITDNRTGKTYEVPIEHGAIRALDLRQIKTDPADFGLMTYDPGYLNTASCKSSITFIDGDRGILHYRGYPIEQLAERSNFLETAYLIMYGELPTRSQFEEWRYQITHHTILNENTKKLMDGFRYDAHPMGMFISTVAALSTFYPEAKNIFDEQVRRKQIYRLIAKVPTIAAFSYRHNEGMPYAYPDNDLSYTGNFLNMLFKRTELKYKPDPVLERALDILFILHADHEQNASTSTVRLAGSSGANPFACIAAGIASLWGPAHGGANEAVLNMLRTIGSKEKIPEYIKRAKSKDDSFRLMGFGHRVYKNYDPRAAVMRKTCHEVLEELGVKHEPLLDLAMELERIALEDDYFVSKKLYPNVDFYSGIILRAMGFPTSMFTVLFALARTVGWVAQWKEMIEDPSQKIGRPRQLYTGATKRPYMPLGKRS